MEAADVIHSSDLASVALSVSFHLLEVSKEALGLVDEVEEFVPID